MIIPRVDVGAGGDEEFSDLRRSVRGRKVQRLIAVVAAPRIDIRALCDQRRNRGRVSPEDRSVEGSPADVISWVDFDASGDEKLDAPNAAGARGPMKGPP